MSSRSRIHLYGIDEFGISIIDDIYLRGKHVRQSSRLEPYRLRFIDPCTEGNEHSEKENIDEDGDKDIDEDLKIDIFHHRVSSDNENDVCILSDDECELALVIYELKENDSLSLAKKVTEKLKDKGVFTIDVVVVPFLEDESDKTYVKSIRRIQEYADGLIVMFSDNIAGLNDDLKYGVERTLSDFYKDRTVKDIAERSLSYLLNSFGSLIYVEIKDLRTVFPKGKIRYIGMGRSFGINGADIAINSALSSIAFDSHLLFEENTSAVDIFASFYGATLYDMDNAVELLRERFEDVVGNVIFSADHDDDTSCWEYTIIMPPIKGYLGCYDHRTRFIKPSSNDFKFIDLI